MSYIQVESPAELFYEPPFEVPSFISKNGIVPESKFGMTHNLWDEWLRIAYMNASYHGSVDNAVQTLQFVLENPRQTDDAVVLYALGHDFNHGVVESPVRREFLERIGLEGHTYDEYQKTRFAYVRKDEHTTAPLMRCTRRLLKYAVDNESGKIFNLGIDDTVDERRFRLVGLYSRTFADIDRRGNKNVGHPVAEAFWLSPMGKDAKSDSTALSSTAKMQAVYRDPLQLRTSLLTGSTNGEWATDTANVDKKSDVERLRLLAEDRKNRILEAAASLAKLGADHNLALTTLFETPWITTEQEVSIV